MSSCIKQRSFITLFILGILTLGIYPIVFWHKLSKEVNVLCEGDGKKTMKYVFVWLLNIVTLGIFGLVWKCKLTNRLKENASRYGLKFSESGALVVVLCTVFFPIGGLFIAHCIMIKNFNAMGAAFNEYNGLIDEKAKNSVFADFDED